jgi:dynein heavy chain, axonemal
VLQQLENAEFKWKGLKKKMLNRREQLASLQQTEAIEIRRKSDAFNERVDDYRKFFLKRAPFGVPPSADGSPGELKLEHIRPAYGVLDAFHHGQVDGYPSVLAITAESKALQEAQELFELYQSDYLMLQRCGEELLHLKSLWDMGKRTCGHACWQAGYYPHHRVHPGQQMKKGFRKCWSMTYGSSG